VRGRELFGIGKKHPKVKVCWREKVANGKENLLRPPTHPPPSPQKRGKMEI
jgi:hypothetical protein